MKDDKPRSPTLRLEGEETKLDHDKEREQMRESKDSKESLRDRPSTKDSLKVKEREKSAKSDRGEKDKLPKPVESKSRSGSKLSVIDKPERSKSGGLSPKGRRMSRMEKPGDLTKSKTLHYIILIFAQKLSFVVLVLVDFFFEEAWYLVSREIKKKNRCK